jgi:hypothetical protein
MDVTNRIRQGVHFGRVHAVEIVEAFQRDEAVPNRL